MTRTGMEYILREIPYIFVAGQMEPLQIVPRPTVRTQAVSANTRMAHYNNYACLYNSVHPVTQHYLALEIVRMLQTNLQQGVSFEDIRKRVLKYSLHNSTSSTATTSSNNNNNNIPNEEGLAQRMLVKEIIHKVATT
jgi:hypothetical protein